MSDFYKKKNPHRLFRDKERAMLAGVCAGIADYAGLNVKATRIVWALLCLTPMAGFMIVCYIVLAIVLPVKPVDLYETQETDGS